MSDNFDKSTILSSFLDEVSAYIPEIETHLDRLQQSPDDEEALEEAYRRTHSIYGSAAMMEFHGLARIAQGMELVLDDSLEQRTRLDQPTIALLRRSCGRLKRSAQAIRSGASDADVVAEDDSDRRAYRGASSPLPSSDWLAQGGASSASSPASMTSGTSGSSGAYTPVSQPAPGADGQAPLPDWLAAFGQNGGSALPASDPWAASVSQLATGLTAAAPADAANGAGSPPTPQLSAPSPSLHADPFAAPAHGWDASQATAQIPMPSAAAGHDISTDQTAYLSGSGAGDPASDWGTPTAPPATPATSQEAQGAVSVIGDLRADGEDVRRQVASLHDTVAILYDATQAIESERVELQSFLDGSHDALERLEEWVGQQMGLDLRESPETVRGYLPLSVIWVTTMRLKKLIGLLNSSSRQLTMTQEGVDETLRQFSQSLDTLSRFSALFAAGEATNGGGFSATVAQVTWNPTASTTTSAPGALTPAQRAEAERTVREELRRSLEDEVRREIAAEVRSNEEQRLRQELELQLRRQMTFAALGSASGESEVTVRAGGVEVRPQAARPVPSVQITSEQSPEALEVFQEEALEHLQTITAGIAALERAPGDQDAIRSVRRAMHTLKGAAGMMGFVVAQSLAHASEDLLDQLAERQSALSPDELSLVFDTAEMLDRLVSGAAGSPQQQREDAQALIDRYANITGVAVANLIESSPLQTIDDTAEADPAPSGELEQGSASLKREDLSVRMKLSRLDELISLFGDLLVNRSVFEERVGRVAQLIADSTQASERLREVGGQLETQFETYMLPSGQTSEQQAGQPGAGQPQPGFRFPWGGHRNTSVRQSQGPAPAHLRDFHELELDRYNEFHRLSRILSEAVTDVVSLNHEMETLVRETQVSFARETRLSSEVQDRLLKARLVPLSSLGSRLYRAARASALKEGKEVEFFLEGGETEVDRNVIEEVEGPLLHLVRNAVNHGIERTAMRQASGKPRAGKIVVAASYEGNQVVIQVRDDGQGIDPGRIRQTAVSKGWVDAYSNLSDREAINLIFQPGMSTAETLTEESGRGVGLDVVRDAATRLRGSVEVDSNIGSGSTFTLKFPISLQIARAVLVKAADQTYAIPMAVVEQIGRLDYYERVAMPEPSIMLRNERYPISRLTSYLKLPGKPLEERASILIINAGRHKVALAIDGIVNQQEIVAKPMGPHLRDVPGVAGATALGNGQVVIILDLLELLSQPAHESLTLPEPGKREAPAAIATPPATRAPRPDAPAASPYSFPMPGSTPTAPANEPPRSPVSWPQPGVQPNVLPAAQAPVMPPTAPAAQQPAAFGSQGAPLPASAPNPMPAPASRPAWDMPGSSVGGTNGNVPAWPFGSSGFDAPRGPERAPSSGMLGGYNGNGYSGNSYNGTGANGANGVGGSQSGLPPQGQQGGQMPNWPGAQASAAPQMPPFMQQRPPAPQEQPPSRYQPGQSGTSGSWQAIPGAHAVDLPMGAPNGAGQGMPGLPAPASQPITAQRPAWAQGGPASQVGQGAPAWPIGQRQELPPLDPAAQASAAPRPDPFSRSSVMNQPPAAAQPTGRDFVVASREMTNSGRLILPASKQAAYVLVVDDSPSVRRVVSGMLKANGWDPRSARDGVEALEMIGKERPAAVLLDIEMPRMDGYELMATLRSDAQYRTLPLIVLTSRAASKHQQRATQLGADAYIIKPYQDDFLLNTLATLIQREMDGGH